MSANYDVVAEVQQNEPQLVLNHRQVRADVHRLIRCAVLMNRCCDEPLF